jgi:hypothetical protein
MLSSELRAHDENALTDAQYRPQIIAVLRKQEASPVIAGGCRILDGPNLTRSFPLICRPLASGRSSAPAAQDRSA